MVDGSSQTLAVGLAHLHGEGAMELPVEAAGAGLRVPEGAMRRSQKPVLSISREGWSGTLSVLLNQKATVTTSEECLGFYFLIKIGR